MGRVRVEKHGLKSIAGYIWAAVEIRPATNQYIYLSVVRRSLVACAVTGRVISGCYSTRSGYGMDRWYGFPGVAGAATPG